MLTLLLALFFDGEAAGLLHSIGAALRDLHLLHLHDVRRHMKWHRLWARLRETLLIGLVDV